MSKKIKILAVILLAVGFILTGCEKNTDSKKNYAGTFKNEDSSYIEITKDGDAYKATISIINLTEFENCTVDGIKDNVLTINGKDPNNNPIKFSFDYNMKVLTVVESTWGLLNNGTKFNFE